MYKWQVRCEKCKIATQWEKKERVIKKWNARALGTQSFGLGAK